MLAWLLCKNDKDLARAKILINKALVQNPENPNFIDTLGWIYYKQNKFDKSLEQLKKASKLAPKNAAIIDHLGDVYKALGNKKEAAENWEKALKLIKDETLKKKIEEKLNK